MRATPIELRRTPASGASREALPPDLRRELALVEEGIAVDPFHPMHRLSRFDGCTVDLSGYGLAVAYRILNEEAVLLVELQDLSNPRSP